MNVHTRGDYTRNGCLKFADSKLPIPDRGKFARQFPVSAQVRSEQDINLTNHLLNWPPLSLNGRPAILTGGRYDEKGLTLRFMEPGWLANYLKQTLEQIIEGRLRRELVEFLGSHQIPHRQNCKWPGRCRMKPCIY